MRCITLLAVYLCGGLQQRRRQLLLRGAPAHPWQPAGRPEPQRGPVSRTLPLVSGWGEAVLMGVGQLANPGHAGRGAGLEAAAREEGGEGAREKEDKKKKLG